MELHQSGDLFPKVRISSTKSQICNSLDYSSTFDSAARSLILQKFECFGWHFSKLW